MARQYPELPFGYEMLVPAVQFGAARDRYTSREMVSYLAEHYHLTAEDLALALRHNGRLAFQNYTNFLLSAWTRCGVHTALCDGVYQPAELMQTLKEHIDRNMAHELRSILLRARRGRDAPRTARAAGNNPAAPRGKKGELPGALRRQAQNEGPGPQHPRRPAGEHGLVLLPGQIMLGEWQRPVLAPEDIAERAELNAAAIQFRRLHAEQKAAALDETLLQGKGGSLLEAPAVHIAEPEGDRPLDEMSDEELGNLDDAELYARARRHARRARPKTGRAGALAQDGAAAASDAGEDATGERPDEPGQGTVSVDSQVPDQDAATPGASEHPEHGLPIEAERSGPDAAGVSGERQGEGSADGGHAAPADPAHGKPGASDKPLPLTLLVRIAHEIASLRNVTPSMLDALTQHGITTSRDVAELSPERLRAIVGKDAMDFKGAFGVVMAARSYWLGTDVRTHELGRR